MLPPIDSSVLKNNPQFANLYKGLTELILNDDGSTKLHPQNPVAQERKAVTEVSNPFLFPFNINEFASNKLQRN